ncbi:MAG: flagellar basal body P-ring formation protein FlgA [Selenomonadaceae bacterium]|nr:flagellar basal body P-ring formation protein FlgA [Selenomonadaceae bacterium]
MKLKILEHRPMYGFFNLKVLLFILLILTAVPVSVNAQVISGRDLEAATINKIEMVLDNRGDMRRRDIHFFHQMQNVVVPDGMASIEVDVPGQINYGGMTSVIVKCRVDGRICKTLNFTVRVRIYDVVLIAEHDLTYDKAVNATDFRQDEIIVDGRTNYIKDFSLIKNLVPSHMIRAGSPVTINMFRTAMVVQANQPVRLRIRYHGIEASAKGIAMNRGRVGEMIKVKNESSGKIITGKVVDEQTVEVIY